MGQCHCCDSRDQQEISMDQTLNSVQNPQKQKQEQVEVDISMDTVVVQERQKKLNFQITDEQKHLPSKNEDKDVNYTKPVDTPYFLSKEYKIIQHQNQYEEGDIYETFEFKSTKNAYSGHWKYKEMHGTGVYIWADGSIYQGHWKNNLADGHGYIIYADGSQYKGYWKNDKMNGQGEYKDKDQTKVYVGEFVDDYQQGQGIETFKNERGEINQYNGQFVKGLKSGQGKMIWHDGSQYIGKFKNNIMDGKGEYTWPDKRTYKGEWKNGKMHGQGVFTWQDGRIYDGHFKEDLKHGYGKFIWPDGREYDGFWHEGKQNGKGTFKKPIMLKIKQEDGKEVEEKQIQEKTGTWENGKFKKWDDIQNNQNNNTNNDNDNQENKDEKQDEDTIVKD